MFPYSINNSNCKKCRLHEKAQHPCILGRGNIESKVMILGECPGKTEDAAGQVFVGESGRLLQHHLDSIGLECFITNAVLCRPTDAKGNNKTPTPTEIECCKPFTIDMIRTMKPKVIIPVGRIAMHQLIKMNLNMEVARGKSFYHPELETYIIPTYYPAFLLRTHDRRFIQEFASDLKLAKDLSERPTPRRIPSTPKSFSDPYLVEEYLKSLLKVNSLSVDLETTGKDPKKDRITDISLCGDMGKGVHIPWPLIAEFPKHIEILKAVLESDKIEKVFHNADFDVRFLEAVGFLVKGPIFDTMLAYHNLTMSYEGGKASSLYKLKTLTWFLTQEGGYESVLDDVGGIVGAQKAEAGGASPTPTYEQPTIFDTEEMASIMNLDFETEKRLNAASLFIQQIKHEKLAKLGLKPKEYYSAMDADVTYRIYRYLKLQIEEFLHYPFYEITMPLCRALMYVHNNGIKLDIPYIDNLIIENREEAEKVKKEFFDEIGYTLNLDSTENLRTLIFTKLKVQKNEKFMTPGGKSGNRLPSTDAEALTYYAKQKPVLKRILDYRAIQKQSSTYLVGFKDLADENARIYPEYNQIGTATGRISATNPNLQNVPRNNRIRNMIIPEDGHKFVIADLSQVELRILAMISGDQSMIRAFEMGHDFHTYTACVMFDIPIDTFDKGNKEHNEKRSVAKTINFGIVYQMHASSLAEQLQIPISRAEGFMKRFFGAYPKVPEWAAYIKAFAKQNGYVENIYGRRRYLPNIFSSDDRIREGAERQAVNTPVQGSAGDICFIGLIRFQQWLLENKMKSKIVGTVHDSILVEAPFDEVDVVASVLPQTMTQNIPRVTVEIKADVDILDKWVK